MHHQSNDNRPRSQASLISFESANRLRIVTVARALSITVHGQSAKCWRHEDRHASVAFNRCSNRWKCFVCDDRTRSVIDLVMARLGVSARDAAQWLASRFSVEDLTPVFHLQRRVLSIRRMGRRRISLDQIAKRLDSFSPVELKVFVGLYNIARGGSFRLSLRNLAMQVNLGKDVVHRTVRFFKQNGILQIESSMSRCANFYVLRLEMLVPDQIAHAGHDTKNGLT